jgi:hypothetical protein
MRDLLQDPNLGPVINLVSLSLNLIAVVVMPIVLLLFGGIGYLLTRHIEQAPLREALQTRQIQVDTVRAVLEARKLANDLPAFQAEKLWKPMEEVLGISLQAVEPTVGPSNIVCMVSGRPRTVRAEGVTELTGDILLQFVTGAAARVTPDLRRLNIAVSFNANVTNRPERNGRLSEVILSTAGANEKTDFPTTRATLAANNRIEFANVTIPPSQGFLSEIRVSNVRLDAGHLGRAGNSNDFRLLAFVSIRSDESGQPIYLANELVTVGHAVLGAVFSLETPEGGTSPRMQFEAVRENGRLLRNAQRRGVTVNLQARFEEGFDRAFSSKREELAIGIGADDAVTGTRFILRFFDVPVDVAIFVSGYNMGLAGATPPGLKAVFVSDPDANGAGGSLVAPGAVPANVPRLSDGTPIMPIPISGGFGIAVWEWVADDGTTPTEQDVRFGIVAATNRENPASGAFQVSGALAPVTTVTTSSSRGPVPRFTGYDLFIQTLAIVSNRK